MKSKSLDMKIMKQSSEKSKANKSFDFTGFYKTAAETNEKLSRRKSVENTDKENNNNSSKDVPNAKRERSPNKKKKKLRNVPLDVSSTVNIDGETLNGSLAGQNDLAQASSTPNAISRGKNKTPVKSIMKTSSNTTEPVVDTPDVPNIRRKKRNKSVSFMLDDNEAVAMKKTKSDDALLKNDATSKNSNKENKKNKNRFKKHKVKNDIKMEIESVNINSSMDSTDIKSVITKKKEKSKLKPMETGDVPVEISETAAENSDKVIDKKKKFKVFKKVKKSESQTEVQQTGTNEEKVLTKVEKEKYIKKKKRKQSKQRQTSETELEEPEKKKKKDVEPEIIASDLENLSIGDNAHTLTNLLDEMTVVDKVKKKKTKRKHKNDLKNGANITGTQTPDPDKTVEPVEKLKWKNRKWNKDKKGAEETLKKSVIVEGLPLSIMTTFKKLLAEHFHDCGVIKGIGIAEVYPTEESKPVFTTTIHFEDEEATVKALEKDGSQFRGSRMRIKRPLPATETTVVLRSYGELSDQAVSTALLAAGRIRAIHHLVKGRKTMGTTFVEFDGPEAVERALSLAENVRIGGKKMHISKFEVRKKKRKEKKPKSAESENEGDSEDND